MNKQSRIYVAGHTGLVGSAIVRALEAHGYTNIIKRSSRQLDLRNQQAVQAFYKEAQPEYIFLAAAKVGGIHANSTYPADFIYDNLMMQNNSIHAAFENKVKKLLFLGSTCIYPKLAAQPLKEDYLLTGSLEPTNEWYAVAKIAGIKLCQAYRKQYGCDFIAAMPTNLYGPGDNFDLNNSHVLPALIRKFHEAKMNGDNEVVIWGSGKPKREFCYVEDCADACLFLMQHYSDEQIVNIGVGEDVSISNLALAIKDIVGYQGEITCDTSKPDGTPRKLVDVSYINTLGWQAVTSLEQGIRQTYEWYINNET